jgi:hypothetical protein
MRFSSGLGDLSFAIGVRDELIFHSVDHDIDLAAVVRVDLLQDAVALLERRQWSLLMPDHQ